MKVTIVNEGDWGGNAYKLVTQLTGSLNREGIEVTCLVRVRRGISPLVQTLGFPADLRSRLVRGARRIRMSCKHYRWPQHVAAWEGFDSGFTQYGRQLLSAVTDAEILNLHFVSQLVDIGVLLPAATARHQVVWTVHDMNPFTGGCHFDGGCDRFVSGCGCCPQLARCSTHDLSAWAWERKAEALAAVAPSRLTFVAPSRWMAKQLHRSPLTTRFPIRTIPYAVDLETFKPRGKTLARDLLGLPQNKRIILFAAQSIHNKRKGFSLLCDALRLLADIEDVCLVFVGVCTAKLPVPLPRYHLGYFDNDRLLSLAYSAADIFAAPSLQDNLPCTVLESLACGTPVVGFDVGGIPDMVRPGSTGQLVEPGSAAGFAEAIRQLLINDAHRREMAECCRLTAEREYSPQRQARSYMELFETLAGDVYKEKEEV